MMKPQKARACPSGAHSGRGPTQDIHSSLHAMVDSLEGSTPAHPEVDIDTARLVHSKTRHLPGEVLSRLEPQILVGVAVMV